MDDERSLVLGLAGVRQAEEWAQKKLEQSMLEECNSFERHVQMVNCVVEPEDPSFTDVLWKTTIEYLTEKGGHIGGWTLVREFHKIKPQWRHVPFLVAVIHKMVPNGLGDTMVVMKDPTSTVQASIHRSTISDNKYGPHMKEVSVLLLKKVVVVKVEWATTYLNISLQNITNLIYKENMATTFIQESGSSGVKRSVLLLKKVVVVKFERATTYLNISLQNITNVISKENMATAFIQESGSNGVKRNPNNWLSHADDEGSTTDDSEEIDE